jgi:hypothetical protein
MTRAPGITVLLLADNWDAFTDNCSEFGWAAETIALERAGEVKRFEDGDGEPELVAAAAPPIIKATGPPAWPTSDPMLPP